MTGTLSIVGTPIGNLEDVTLRALRTLGEADVVASEDTRRTGILLSRHNIRKPLLSFHQFNEARRTEELIDLLRHGKNVAVVSDAGMPTVSDPGQRLIAAAIAIGAPVSVVPGPSAVTMAAAMSGLPCERFFFYGFLPHKSGQRRKTLESMVNLPYSLIFFESPYRIKRTVEDMRDVLGERRTVIARELTKKFEEVIRGTLRDLAVTLEKRSLKGEITIVVEGMTK
jgi:16S rRNA (cytidine1402-2'-O)-methyltransferase